MRWFATACGFLEVACCSAMEDWALSVGLEVITPRERWRGVRRHPAARGLKCQRSVAVQTT